MTPRQKAFVAAFLKDGNATKAAEKAGYSARTAKQQGSRLLTNADVAQAVEKGQQRVAEKAELTVASHLQTLEGLRDKAIAAGQLTAAIRAEELRGKVTGFYTERVEHSGSVEMSHEQREQSVLLLLRQAKERKQRGMVS